MAAPAILSEFSLPQRRQYNRRTPLIWILSHIGQHGYLVLLTFLGAAGNAVTNRSLDRWDPDLARRSAGWAQF